MILLRLCFNLTPIRAQVDRSQAEDSIHWFFRLGLVRGLGFRVFLVLYMLGLGASGLGYIVLFCSVVGPVRSPWHVSLAKAEGCQQPTKLQ